MRPALKEARNLPGRRRRVRGARIITGPQRAAETAIRRAGVKIARRPFAGRSSHAGQFNVDSGFGGDDDEMRPHVAVDCRHRLGCLVSQLAQQSTVDCNPAAQSSCVVRPQKDAS